MKKGDRVRLSHISIILPPGSEGVLVKSYKYEYDIERSWKVLLHTRRGIEVRRVLESMLEVVNESR
jgi:hypothetical protein